MELNEWIVPLIVTLCGALALCSILLLVVLKRNVSLSSQVDDYRQQLDELRESMVINREQLAERQRDAIHLREKTANLQDELSGLKEIHQEKSHAFDQLSHAYVQLQTRQAETDRRHQEQIKLLNDSKEALSKEFENLANRIFDEKSQSFSQTSTTQMVQLLEPFKEQIKDFRGRVDVIHRENNESAGGLRKELEHIRQLNQALSHEAQSLTEALKGDKKTTGLWGEMQLKKALELAGLIEGVHFRCEVSLKDVDNNRWRPDFIVDLPEDKHLVLDSKVSLVDFSSAIASHDDVEYDRYIKQHISAVRKHVDTLSDKGYARLDGIDSPSFVLMFMPVEAAYVAALKNDNGIFDYAYQKGVILVSHTTLMPILKTVANLWSLERSHKEVKEISERAGDLYHQVCLLGERINKLGGSLIAATNHFNSVAKALVGQQGLHGKVERFSMLSSKVSKQLPDVKVLHNDVDIAGLENLLNENASVDQAG